MGRQPVGLVDAWTSTQWLPYVLFALTLPSGLLSVFGFPFPVQPRTSSSAGRSWRSAWTA